jgi:hypothetical protein
MPRWALAAGVCVCALTLAGCHTVGGRSDEGGDRGDQQRYEFVFPLFSTEF